MKRLMLLVAFAALAAGAAAQERPDGIFRAEYSTRDISAAVGINIPIKNGDEQKSFTYLSLGYTSNFWRNFAWKGGFQLSEASAYDGGVAGLSLGLAWRPGIRSWEQSVAYGLETGISDAVFDGINGRTDRVKDDLISSVIGMLFRRTEFYLGVTPGYCLGQYSGPEDGAQRFSLFGDVGVIFSFPIWHLCLNIPVAYHYNFLHNDYYSTGDPIYHYFSVGIGLGWLF